MNDSLSLREVATIQEEISDLSEYLDGLPKELRNNGAFRSYEYRMVDLNRELAQSMLYHTYLKGKKIAVPTADEFHATIDKQLASLEREHTSSANRYATVTKALQYALFVGASLALITAVASFEQILTVTLIAIELALAALLSFSRLTDRARTEERLADYFKALRNETTNIFSCAGEINVEPWYYGNSTKIIQSIIQDIGAQRQME